MDHEIRDRLDQALANPEGVTLHFQTAYDAMRFRMRAYAERRKDMAANRKIHPKGHPLWGTTPYDNLTFRIEDDTMTIRLRPPVPPATPIPDQAHDR